MLPLSGTLLCILSLYLLTGRPAMRVYEARRWVQVPCEIVSSEVARHRSSDSRNTLYRIDITFRYAYGGKSYTSGRYDFMGDRGSSGYESKARVVASYPPGSKAMCHVNPSSPQEAVLDRGLPARMLWALIPLAFLPFGVLGLIMGVFMGLTPDR